MKKYVLLSFFLLVVSGSGAHERIDFIISKPLCVLTFLQAANGTGSVAPSLSAYISKHISASDSATLNKAVREFSGIGFNNSYVYSQYPAHRQHPKTVINLITIAAVRSASISEFLDRITGILPNEQWMAMRNAMTAAAPLYEKMIFEPYKDEIAGQIKELRKFNSSADTIFSKLKHFYGSTWGDDMPFTIAVYPVPGRRGNTTASPHSNSLVLAVLTRASDHVISVGVAIHEICHVLYQEQPLWLQQRADSSFLRSNSDYRRYAYSYIDEALATACGNGWAYKVLSGHIDKTGWYNDNYINGYAHALYPMVTEYIAAGKTMDKEFTDRAIGIFEQTFPDAIYDYPIVLNSLNLYTDAKDHKEYEQVNTILRDHFNIRSCSGSYPITDPQSLDMISRSEGTQLIIVHTNHEENYKALETKFPKIKELDAKQEGIASFFDDRKRPVVIINAADINRLGRVVKKMAGSGRISTGRVFTAVD